jgi:hypothetical protein
MNTLRRSSGIAAAVALAAAGLVGAGITPASAEKETAKLTPTAYGLASYGYATKLTGGELPTGSDKVAYSVVACTNKAGMANSNTEADGDLGNGLTFEGATTHAWTTKQGNVVSSWSRHKIAKVQVLGSPLGDLSLIALSSTSHAWHDTRGYHASSTSSLGAIEFAPVNGQPQEFPVPSPGQSVTVPGVARISLGTGKNTKSPGFVATNINALRINLLLTHTNVWIGHTHAEVSGTVKQDLFGGSSYATKLDLLNGLVTSGRTVPTSVPCVGTFGKETVHSLASVNLADTIAASALTSSQRSGLTAPGARPEVTTGSRIGHIDLGGGLVINAIRAQAHVWKADSGFRMDIGKTSVGLISLNDAPLEFPVGSDVLEIPGIAKLERNVVTRGARSISVTGLRVTLLDGTAADTVLDLANAKAALQPSGL